MDWHGGVAKPHHGVLGFMILYHSYAESLTDHPRLAATWQFLRDHDDTLRQRGWQFVHQPCGPDTRYEDGLKALWGQDDLVILEQDLVPTLDVLISLEPAHHPLCAQSYPLYHEPHDIELWKQAMDAADRIRQTHPEDPHADTAYHLCAQAYHLWHSAYRPDPTQPRRMFATLAHRRIDPADPDKHRWIADGEEWADLAGFGLLRITKAFQQTYAPGWRPGPWNNLDTRFSEWVHLLGVPFHVHYPTIPHHHRCPCHPEA